MDKTDIPLRYVKLGLTPKLSLFKVLDALCNPEKQPLTRDLWSKPSSKSHNYDCLEYLKSISTKPTESQTSVAKPANSVNSELTNSDDVKKTIRKYRCKKLCVLTDSCGGDSKSNSTKYLFSIQNVPPKSKNQIISWFAKRKFSSLTKPTFCPTNDPKRVKVEWKKDIELVCISPTFYCSNRSLRFDTDKMVFYLNIRGLCGIELETQNVRNVTVHKNQSSFKIGVKGNLLTDLSNISNDVVDNLSSPIKIVPKKTTKLKDLLIFFTSTPISNEDVLRLKSVLGEEKVVLSDTECKEMYENIFHSMPKVVETLSKNLTINWSLLNRDPRPLGGNVIKTSFMTPKKSPIPGNNSPATVGIGTGIGGARKSNSSSSIIQTVPNLVLHQTANVVTMNPNTSGNGSGKQTVSAVYCAPNTSTPFLGANHHIVIGPNLTVNRTDPYPNLFNRMINDSPALSHAIANQTSYSFAVPSGNIQSSNQQQITNFSSLFQRQTLVRTTEIAVDTMDGSNGTMVAKSNNTVLERNLPTNLVYVPGRDTSNIFQSFNYAPSPECSVSIHGSDLTCLNEGQYLNDNIINFYLNYIRYERATEDQRQRSHLFNVFFYTKLHGFPSNIGEPAEVRHGRVAKWTKKVDIFDKDFIVIPINEAQHWFLGIICFPWMAGMISYDSLYGLTNPQLQTEIPINTSQFATRTRLERVRWLQTEKKIDPKPCILLFDSLQLQNRAPNVKLIREYLRSEWDAKRRARDGPLVFDKNTIRGFNPQVPQQSNTIDCGVYVLHYVEMFFAHPLPVFTKEYFQSSLTQWFDKETVEMKREFIQKLLLMKGEAQNQVLKEPLLSPKIGTEDSGPDIQIVKIQ